MKQIKNLSESFEIDDYAIFRVGRGLAMAKRVDDEYIHIYTERVYIGSLFLYGYRDGWRYVHQYRANRGITAEDIANKLTAITNAEFTITDISEEDVKLIHCDNDPNYYDDSTSLINETYSDDTIYRDIHFYHRHKGETMNYPIGFKGAYKVGVELEVEFKDEDSKYDFTELESNWLYKEEDGSLDDFGVEIITVPLRPSDAKNPSFWQPLADKLGGLAYAWESDRCGLHVHISKEILGKNEDRYQYNLGKLLYLYHHHIKETEFNIAVYGRKECYSENDGKVQSAEAVKSLGTDVLKIKDVRDKVSKDVKDRSNTTRYFDINIKNEHTIEFRKGQGTFHPKRIAMVVEYCEMLCLFAKKTAWHNLTYDNFIEYVRKHAKSDLLKAYLKTK